MHENAYKRGREKGEEYIGTVKDKARSLLVLVFVPHAYLISLYQLGVVAHTVPAHVS